MLPRLYRISKDRDFVTIGKHGRSLSCQYFRCKYLRTESPVIRFGIVISAKISKKAIVRNRLKRQMRAIIAKYMQSMHGGYDVVIYMARSAVKSSFADLEHEFIGIAARAHFITIS